MRLKYCFPVLFMIGVAAQPALRDVRNAAGGVNPVQPGYGIAPGSLISIAGKVAADPQVSGLPLAASLGGVAVQILVGGTQIDALMVAINDSGILAIVPSTTPLGDAKVRVNDATGTMELTTAIVARNYGIFARKALASTSAGAAYAMNVSDAGNSWNGFTSPVVAGQTILIFGSGAGPTPQDETNPVNPEPLAGDFRVSVGGKAATVVSVERSPLGIDSLGLAAGLAGVDTIAAVVPDGVTGCSVPVAVTTDGTRLSNYATISVSADGGACSDAGFAPGIDLLNLPTSGTLTEGTLSISRTNIGGTQVDSAAVGFRRYDAQEYLATYAGTYVSAGSCLISYIFPGETGVYAVRHSTPLDAGAKVQVKGPKATISLSRLATGAYGTASATGGLPGFPGGTLFADVGAFAVNNATGGADVGSFDFHFDNPEPLVWTNAPKTLANTVDRAAGMTVNWTGGGDSLVIIEGVSLGDVKGDSVGFTCSAPAAARSFTVPAEVLSALPGMAANGAGPRGTGQVVLLALRSGKFTAPGLDVGIYSTVSGTGASVLFR